MQIFGHGGVISLSYHVPKTILTELAKTRPEFSYPKTYCPSSTFSGFSKDYVAHIGAEYQSDLAGY